MDRLEKGYAGPMLRWESGTRYCTAALEQDLLGDTIVLTTHGGRYNKLGGVRAYVVPDQAAGERKIRELHKVRRRHGYQLVANLSGIELEGAKNG